MRSSFAQSCSKTVASRKAKYPVGESNPCLRRERAVSWATRRTGRGVGLSILRSSGRVVYWTAQSINS